MQLYLGWEGSDTSGCQHGGTFLVLTCRIRERSQGPM